MSSAHCNNNNLTPVIGVLCIDIAEPLRKLYGNEYYSYIAASYVKYLESSGARVIPIWINRSRYYYETIMKKINGILLPGGAVFFDNKYCTEVLRNDCVLSSKYIYEIARELNEKGKHFPLWGTCLGFQLMLTHSADIDDIRQDCVNMNCSLPVKFEPDEVLENSKLFGHIDKSLKDKMSSLPFGCHYHRYCITKEDLNFFKIARQWKVLACNEDENGLEFITILEHNKYPFFGSQIHPERVMYENFGKDDAFHHCLDCFELTKYFGNFFVTQCSLNENHFESIEEELKYNIGNFAITYTAADKLHWRQCYLFKFDIDYPHEQEKVVDEVLKDDN